MVGRVDGAEWCQPTLARDYDTISDLLNGESRISTWLPMEMKVVSEDEGVTLAFSDALCLGHQALVLRPAAVSALGAMLSQYGELLRARCALERREIFNATTIIDALDEAASTVMRYSTGKVMDILNYAFVSERVAGVQIFRIPQFVSSPIFVGSEFVEMRADSGLHGWRLRKFGNRRPFDLP